MSPTKEPSPAVDQGLAAACTTLAEAVKSGAVKFYRPPSEMPWVDERAEHRAVRRDARE